MIGQGENRWRYDFDCNDCTNTCIKNGAVYCIPLSSGRNPLDAGDDYVLRCSEFKGGQMNLFDAGDS